MSEYYDKWEISGVLPYNSEECGEWVICTNSSSDKKSFVYHKHYPGRISLNPTLIASINGKCRLCNKTVPKGILFRARTKKLDDV